MVLFHLKSILIGLPLHAKHFKYWLKTVCSSEKVLFTSTYGCLLININNVVPNTLAIFMIITTTEKVLVVIGKQYLKYGQDSYVGRDSTAGWDTGMRLLNMKPTNRCKKILRVKYVGLNTVYFSKDGRCAMVLEPNPS